jgi:hypothetical protein
MDKYNLIYDIYKEDIKLPLEQLFLYACGGNSHYPEWAQNKILKEFKPSEIIATAAKMIQQENVPTGIKYNIFFWVLYNFGLGSNADNVKDLVYSAYNFNWRKTHLPTNFISHIIQVINDYINYYNQQNEELIKLYGRSKHVDYIIEEEEEKK